MKSRQITTMEPSEIKDKKDYDRYIFELLDGFYQDNNDFFDTEKAIKSLVKHAVQKTRGESPDQGLENEIAELGREIEMRRKVFPDWVKQGRMSETESKRKIDRMLSAYNRLKQMRDEKAGKQSELFLS